MVGALLFVLSLATLSLEIVQIRIFSYCLNPALVYMSISVALLGFGLSGTVLSLFPGLRRADLVKSLSICLVLFAASALAANVSFARFSHLITPEHGISLVSAVIPLLLPFSIPFFFAGLGIALVLISNARQVGRNYCLNLLGSAAGCFAIYPFLERLGAERVVLGIGLICAACGLLGAALRARAWLPVAALILLALLGGWLTPRRLLDFQPDPLDLLAVATARMREAEGDRSPPQRVFARWDPVGRIDLVRFQGCYRYLARRAPTLFFAQDAGAGSILLGLKEHPRLARLLARATTYGLAASLRPGAEVAVVGVGGGPDLLASLAAGARRVTGIEINEAVVDAVSGRFGDMLGLPRTSDERLRLVHGDGRAHLRQYRGRLDVIQMTGADTFAAGAVSGSLLAENHLYTREAMLDFLRALKPRGLLAITRFGMESLRALTTAVSGLESLGIERPLTHLIAVRQGPVWITLLIKKTAFTEQEIAEVLEICRRSRATAKELELPVYDLIGYGFDHPLQPLYHPGMNPDLWGGGTAVAGHFALFRSLITALERGSVERWLARQAHDFSPPTDDKPFFFHFPRMSWPALAELFGLRASAGPFIWDIRQYTALVFQVSLLSLLLILGPLAALGRLGSLRSAAPLALFFFAIGAGFMLIEIGVMQKLSLFLGHPNHAISTVLFSILLFSGLGSYGSRRLALPARTIVRAAAPALLLCVLGFSLAPAGLVDFPPAGGTALRIAVAVAAVAPLGLLLGLFFPVLLGRTQNALPAFTPWAFGVNGFASVVGSLAAIPLTATLGFSNTLLLGGGAYALAWLVVELPFPEQWLDVTRR